MVMMDFRTIFPIVLLPSCLFAAVNLNVSLGDSIKPVTHVATGSLYGLTETLPSNIEKDVAPLKPNVFLSPAAWPTYCLAGRTSSRTWTTGKMK